MKLVSLVFMLLFACGASSQTNINEAGKTIEERISPPEGYTRNELNAQSFEYYLRTLPLKPNGSIVKYHNGAEKNKSGVYMAVVDMEIGTRDLQQCADAIMRLRGEYLYANKRFNDISFNFTNGFKVEYKEWIKGKRMRVSVNKTNWITSASPSNTYKDFRNYMDLIFTYAGTISLSKELKQKKIKDIKIGDVFIQGGSPGHAVIVVDMAENKQNGKKVFLLAQSYMPAQDIQILQNPNNKRLSPWYEADFSGNIVTPEWTFTANDLKSF